MDKYIEVSPVFKRHKTSHNAKVALYPTINLSKNITKKVQLYLDFGQKSFGETVCCPECEMVYVKSDLEDSQRHQNYCKQVE
jgi:hypothetical protein